jgi:phosphate transport system substrate-binding protein
LNKQISLVMKSLYFLGLAFGMLVSCGPATPPESVLIDGSNGVRPLVAALVEAYRDNNPGVDIRVGTEGLGSKARLDALEAGSIQMAMASHGLDEEDILRRGMEIHHFASMAVVFGVHEEVRIQGLTVAELCGIYTGKLINWDFTDMYSLPIVPLMRPFDEVDTEVALAAMPCLQEMKLTAPVQVKESAGDMAKALVDLPGSIGLTNMIRISESKGKIQALSINGVAPSPENIRSGKYPMYRNNYLVTLASASATVRDFLSFVESPAGQAVIAANSAFVP